MFLRIASVLLLSVSSYASSIDVSMIDMADVWENHRIITDSYDPYSGAPLYGSKKATRGVSLIKPEFKKFLMETANMEASFIDTDPSEWHEVQTTFLSGTSSYHQDCIESSSAPVEDEVGFIVLNTNNDAYFDHPDMKVPIREGAFIRFNGNDRHRTVVNKGIVHLLGPFELKSFEKTHILLQPNTPLLNAKSTKNPRVRKGSKSPRAIEKAKTP